jgi:hypothetical protein
VRPPLRVTWHALVALTLASFVYAAPARAAEPMKVGLSLALTGDVAANGKQKSFWIEVETSPVASEN